jgi:uncharacterized phage-like protein YoqJ
MALGIDQDAAEIVLGLGFSLIAMVPFPAQDSRWQPVDKARYRALLERASKVVLVSEVDPRSHGEAADMLDRRNKVMVTESAVVVACWTGKASGGTWNAIQDAKRLGRALITIRPGMTTTISCPRGLTG